MTYERQWKEGEIASISLWKRDNENPKAPVMTGTVEMKDGRKFDVSLWRSSSTNPKAPVATGVIAEPFERKAQSQAAPVGDYSDDIPF